MQAGSVISISPSFNSSYSNPRLAGIAARVAEEFDSEGFRDEFCPEREKNGGFLEREKAGNSVVPEEDDGEFEFAFARRDSDMPSPVSADEIFCNGQIRPVYPLCNADLFPKRSGFEKANEEGGVVSAVRLPLMKLFIEERETPLAASAAAAVASSSCSSEADELEGVPADTYCVWQPKEAAEGRCQKSSSTGSSSKRWKFGDLLRRSQSDGGKDRFVFLSRGCSRRKIQVEEKVRIAGKVKPTAAAHPPLHNRDGGEKRRSYLPYKQDFVGLFAGVNGLSKNLQPF